MEIIKKKLYLIMWQFFKHSLNPYLFIIIFFFRAFLNICKLLTLFDVFS